MAIFFQNVLMCSSFLLLIVTKLIRELIIAVLVSCIARWSLVVGNCHEMSFENLKCSEYRQDDDSIHAIFCVYNSGDIGEYLNALNFQIVPVVDDCIWTFKTASLVAFVASTMEFLHALRF